MAKPKKPKEGVDINTLIEEFLKNVAKDFAEFSDIKEVKSPIIYGFNVRINSEDSGKVPTISSFGNVKRNEDETKIQLTEDREPLIDIIEKENVITVIAEIPGVNKENIKIDAYPNEVHIDAKDHNRSYNRDVTLDSMIDTKPTSVQFKNGVLEINFNKSKKATKPNTFSVDQY
ncbi:MAG: Hsp20/alpha crystallin family protein [Candidatus Micrarchaeia archaeon]